MRRAFALLALAVLTACGDGTSSVSTRPTPSPHAFHGVQPTPVPARPEWVLHDTDGKVFDLQAQTRGKPTYVYFGYTHCPDECPTAMADLATVLRRADPSVRDQVQVLFVTTDPARDSAPVLRRWLDQFSKDFVGLLGTKAEVAAAQRASGVAPAYPEGPVPTLPGRPDQHVHEPGTAPHKHFGPLGYAVAHSAVIFAYDAADRLPVVYPGGVTPADIAADLPALADP
ncbi:MAG TPA: SCO family protein [Mycobacteriales bacterium]|nr:SCO family protein [Mycobacteriales bacterium]